MSAMSALPRTFRKLVANKISTDFRNATSIVTANIPQALKGNEVLLHNHFVGINASDINFTAGKYMPDVKPPFDVGFEAVATIAAKGSDVSSFQIGDSVAVTTFGSFSEYQVVKAKQCLPLPAPKAEYLTLLVSGLTASISLEKVGDLRSNETVLVTAAAGGTGVFAVQLAKLAGNRVIGTTSSEEKAAELRRLGCDDVVNYRKQDLDDYLKKNYPNGVDLVYESVGGDTFEVCLKHLAVHGRLVVIGAISGYKDGSTWKKTDKAVSLPVRLLTKSSSVRGFFLSHFPSSFPIHLNRLVQLFGEGKLKLVVDTKKFNGLEAIPDAIDYMYEGKNVGKVVVQLSEPAPKPKL